MSNEKTSTIQSTMIGPLWARAKYAQMYPSILKDDQAVKLKEKVLEQYSESQDDFKILDDFVDELLGLAFIIRARTFDDTIRAYIDKKPRAVIVNLGCGLDTTFSRVDNGQLRWFDLDLPDAIEYRKRLIPETSRSKCIPKSVFDPEWMDDIEYNPSDGLLMIAGGLFVYFDEDDAITLFKTLADRLPKSEMIFDISSSRGNWIINRRFKKFGVVGIDHKLEVKSREQIESWSPKIKVIDLFPFFSRIEINPKWGRKTRLMMSMNSRMSLAKFIHVRFDGE